MSGTNFFSDCMWTVETVCDHGNFMWILVTVDCGYCIVVTTGCGDFVGQW